MVNTKNEIVLGWKTLPLSYERRLTRFDDLRVLRKSYMWINGQVAIWTQTLQVYLGRVVSKALFKQTLDILYNTGMLLV